MRGAQQLTSDRLRGHVPALVHVDLDLPRIPQLPRDHLQIEPTDRASTLDLRCVTGLVVSVSGAEPGRTKAIAAACQEAGAARVFAFVCQPSRDGFEVVEMTDTQGSVHWKR